MSDEKRTERLPVMLSPSELRRLDEIRAAAKGLSPTRSDVVRKLIELEWKRVVKKDPASPKPNPPSR